jgi:hypothetical protein
VIYFLFRVIGGISRIPDDWHPANHSAGMGGIQLKGLVTHRLDLHHREDGFDLAATSSECLRVAIKP